jgi:ketosteroid isomerase-like protein
MTATVHTRESLLELVLERYFAAMDRGDVETVVGCFADDSVLITENRLRVEGKSAIREFFVMLSEYAGEMRHDITNVVVDVENGRVACELHYVNDREVRPLDMLNCNFFDVDASGLFTRVKFWLGDPAQFEA